jgi:two-component system, NarL family, response regulator LiaR
MPEPIRILIVDDHALVREGLRAVLETQKDMELVGEARDGEEAVARAALLKPDLVIMDLVIPGKDGVAATREILQANPQIKVLVLSSYLDDEKINNVLHSGAMGYLLKDSNPQELLQAIRSIYRGKSVFDPAVQRKLLDQLHRGSAEKPADPLLTEREAEVLRLMAQGASNFQIAQKLSLAEGTVRFHVSNILGKLHQENRTQAVLYALQKGLVSL